ncbi:MAG: hypothetical protein V1835_05120 [Candidatus Micrarchaeota archaeon]
MYGGVAGRTSHLESSIPLILIIILAIFIAGNFGLVNFSDVPLLGSIFGGKQIKVGVVGSPSPGLKDLLLTKDAQEAGIHMMGILRPESLVASGTLKSFDVVILQGKQVCDRTARRVLTEWVKGGGKLFVIGDACTRVSDDPAAFGWDVGGNLGDVMPVKIGGITHQAEPVRRGCSSGMFRFADFAHPIGAGIDDFHFSGTTIDVTPWTNGNIVSYIDCSDSGKGNVATTPAIVESTGGLGGKVIYWAYDPGSSSRNLFINALKYVKNQKG